MHWGRKKENAAAQTPADISRGARAVIIAGTLICALFFITESSGSHADPVYPPAMAEAAQSAFCRDHAALAAALGLDVKESIPTGTFSVGEGKWSFSRYLQDAFRFLLGGGET